VPRNGGAVDFATNPDDQSSSIILFATGKCQTTGSAPLPEDTPIFTGYLGDYSPTGGWFGVGSRTAQAVRIQVLEWQTPSGWILDSMGNVHEFGGAARANSLGIKPTPDLSQGNAEGLQMDRTTSWNSSHYRMHSSLTRRTSPTPRQQTGYATSLKSCIVPSMVWLRAAGHSCS
jgi:hypothetical protein